MSDKKYLGENAILALKIGVGYMESLIPAAKSMIEVAEAVTKNLDEQPKGRRAAIAAQKERKNAQT